MLQQKITELRKRVKTLEIDTSRINNSISSQLRKAIRENVGDLVLKQTEIPLDKDDAKNIWAKIETYLPLYALFQSDRKIEDGDSEVQDPLKAAIKEAE